MRLIFLALFAILGANLMIEMLDSNMIQIINERNESIQRSITCGNALPHQTFFLLVQPGRSGLSLVEKPLLSSPEAQHRSALHTKFLFHKEHDEMALYTFPLALIRFLDHSPRAVPNLVQPAALDPHL